MANEATQITIGGVTHDVMDVGARNLIASLQAAIDAITGGDTTTAIETFQEVINFLGGVTDDATLIGKLNELRTLINAKYTKPNTGIPASDLAPGVIPDISGKADKATTYTKTEVDGLVANACKVQSVSVNGETPVEPDAQTGNVNIVVPAATPGEDGITPHIDVITGHWFIGDEDTGIDAHGLQGNSGYTGAVGELEVVEDYTEGGVGKAASAEAVKEMAIQSIPDAGSFADAYEKARANNVVFPWFLRDVDENGNPIEKMIWHNGYRKFVDAIGAEVEGQRNGLTIKVNADCDLYLGWKNDISYNSVTVEVTIPLIQGINNFSFAEIHDKFVEELGSEPAAGTTYYLKLFDVRESGTTTSHGNYVEDIDFGGMTVKLIDNFMSNWDSLESIKRMDASAWVTYSNALSGCDKLVDIRMTGSLHSARSINLLVNCSKLERADLRGYEVDFDLVGGVAGFSGCSLLEYVDIRDIDTKKATTISNVFLNDSSLKTLIIGNFDTSSLTDSMRNAFSGVTDCVLICTKNTPPVIKSGYDWLGNGLSNGACHFSAIYVPTNAVDNYKAATGWSEYADLIHDIAGTEYEDLI